MTTAKQKFELLKAHHEAGHAVVARRLSIAVRCVSLFPTDTDTQAHALTESASFNARNEGPSARIAGLVNDAKVGLAGPFAQDRYRPSGNRLTTGSQPDEWDDDISLAQNCAAAVVALRRGISPAQHTLSEAEAAEAQELWVQLCVEVEEVVTANWPTIERVAKALFKCRELTGDELDDIIAGRRIDLSPRRAMG